MKKVIVNADDAGLSDEVNQAIGMCFRAGAITGTSLMSCGNAFSGAVEMLKSSGQEGVGVHLTLTGKGLKACSDPSRITSIAKDGMFPENYFGVLRQMFPGGMNIDQLYLEFAAQIDKIVAAGFKVTHIDSHEHVHMFPGVLRVVLMLARDREIPYVRFPVERPFVLGRDFCPRGLIKHAALKIFTFPGRQRFYKSEIAFNDEFLGHFHSGRINGGVFDFFMDNLGAGVTEIAVHPCVYSESFIREYPWYSNGPVELEVLTGGKWKEKIPENGIELIAHSEVLFS